MTRFFKPFVRICFVYIFSTSILTLNSSSDEIPHHIQSYIVSSGEHDGNGSAFYIAFTHVVSVDDAIWLQIKYNTVNLGTLSYVEMIRQSVKRWRNSLSV